MAIDFIISRLIRWTLTTTRLCNNQPMFVWFINEKPMDVVLRIRSGCRFFTQGQCSPLHDYVRTIIRLFGTLSLFLDPTPATGIACPSWSLLEIIAVSSKLHYGHPIQDAGMGARSSEGASKVIRQHRAMIIQSATGNCTEHCPAQVVHGR